MALIKLNNKAVSNATAFGSISSLGSMTFIKKLTASSSATLSFVDGSDGVVLDDTYKEYVFTYNNMHPATDNVNFSINFSTDSGSNYNVAKTSTYIYTENGENGTGGGVNYNGSDNRDLANGTGNQFLMTNVGADADQSVSGELLLFNPSSTTFVKHFISKNTCSIQNDYNLYTLVAGYGNTTSAIDGVRFQMSSGNIDAGDICLYGIA
jgi:hypothetical protein